MSLVAYQISQLSVSQLDIGIRQAPRYTTFSRRIVEHTIKAIHAVPHLYSDVSPKQVQIYIGRSANNAKSVYGRWDSHHKNLERQHVYGMVLCRVPTDMVSELEDLAIRIINGLYARGRLCVANIAAGPNGPLPSSDDATLYLTWKIQRSRNISLATTDDVRDIAAEVAETTSFSETVLASGLDIVRRPSEAADADWHPAHL
jgi:hypothetical protein